MALSLEDEELDGKTTKAQINGIEYEGQNFDIKEQPYESHIISGDIVKKNTSAPKEAVEIILIMNQNESDKLSTFTELFKDFQQQKKQNVHFNDDDKVEIPIIEFNLEKTYNEFIGSEFYTKEAEYVVTKAYQRNAFVLNENGAEVESEAKFEVVATHIRFDKSKPKMMIFNKPFVVFLKRKDAKHPYFGVYIANEELLKKK